MALVPLKQWFCDRCGEVIEKPGDGWLEFVRGRDELKRGFKIVHHAGASPRGEELGHCYHYEGVHGRSDMYLREYLGGQGIVALLSMIDAGPYHSSDYKSPGVADFREYADLFRRLHVPYYEEARRYWDQAISDGLLASNNEVSIYSPEVLKEVIEQYGDATI